MENTPKIPLHLKLPAGLVAAVDQLAKKDPAAVTRA